MTDFLDKFKITTAKQRQKKFDFRNEHMTTADFCQLGVAQYRNLIPNEKISVNFRAFSRLAPMPIPTFGRANMNVRGFFVPFRTIFPAWNDFITDTPHVSGDGLVVRSAVPTLYNRDILQLLCTNASSSTTATTRHDFASNFDASVSGYQGTTKYYTLNSTGRLYYKIFVSLGYQPLNVITNDNKDVKLSALPLLALAKIYCDWYWPSAYANNSAFAAVDKLFKIDAASDLVLTYGQISNILNLCAFVQYDSDYFVSAFDSPAGPSTDFSTPISMVDSSVSSSLAHSIVKTQQNGTAYLRGESASGTEGVSPQNMSKLALEMLYRVSDYMKRHQLAGSRALDRYLARFGINLAPEKLQRSVYLGSHKIPLMTGDIFSTGQTFNPDDDNITNRVGDYAGKGYIVGNDGHFEFQTDEYGLFMCLYSILPEVGYYQGIDRHNMHISRLDFFTPEFDGMGTRAIASAELYQPTLQYSTAFGDNFSHVFGWTPQYAEYKIGRDCVSGDYRCNSLSAAGFTSPAWHLFRQIGDLGGAQLSAPAQHSFGFVESAQDSEQYNRIFYLDDQSADHFNIHFFFGITSWLPAKPLYDNYDWHEEGEKVTLDVNGVKMN